MIHDLRVAPVSPPLTGDRAQFGTITPSDAAALQAKGSHHNVPGEIFTVDGNAVHFPSSADHFPDRQTNVVPIQLSMGAWNTLQESDGHAYWEFNYTTNWIHPLYELPFTGGIPGTFEAGQIGALQSIIPGSGPAGVKNGPVRYGDNPNTAGVLQASGPRDPDKFDADVDSQREFRQRFIPSGLAKEIFLGVYERVISFEPTVTDFKKRLRRLCRGGCSRGHQWRRGHLRSRKRCRYCLRRFPKQRTSVYSGHPVQSLRGDARD